MKKKIMGKHMFQVHAHIIENEGDTELDDIFGLGRGTANCPGVSRPYIARGDRRCVAHKFFWLSIKMENSSDLPFSLEVLATHFLDDTRWPSSSGTKVAYIEKDVRDNRHRETYNDTGFIREIDLNSGLRLDNPISILILPV